jgi:hypothetical protein
MFGIEKMNSLTLKARDLELRARLDEKEAIVTKVQNERNASGFSTGSQEPSDHHSFSKMDHSTSQIAYLGT